ncbi:hypothetical protein D3C76_1586940 [compost metagenome]
MYSTGSKGIGIVATLPTTPPMAENKTMASDEAIAVRGGIFRIVNITGISIKAPPAPTTPETRPITNAAAIATIRLKEIASPPVSGAARFGISISTTATVARMPYTRLMTSPAR